MHHLGCDKDSSVCSTSTDEKNPKKIGSVGPTVLNSTIGTGFTLQYTGVNCDRGSKWKTNIFMRCGKFLVNINFLFYNIMQKLLQAH